MALPTSKVYIDSAGVLREGEYSQDDLNALAQQVAQKADSSALADKLDISALANYLASKVDTTALQAALASKADATALVDKVSQAAFDAIATKVNNPIVRYISNGDVMTVAQLLANYPASATNVDMFAIVSDLYGSVRDTMKCRFDGTNYRWVPQREAFTGTTAAASGTVSIIPLVTPPTLRAAATLTGNVQFVAQTANAYVGQRQRIVMSGVLGLFTASITGLIGSNLALLGGNSKTIEFNGTGWFSAD